MVLLVFELTYLPGEMYLSSFLADMVVHWIIVDGTKLVVNYYVKVFIE